MSGAERVVETETNRGVTPVAATPLPCPSRVRYSVLRWMCALSMITYIDRVCISQAAPLITAEFRLSPVQMGYVFAAFTWAYALFEIPGGWLGDKLGPRKVLTRVVLWWSFFTAATAKVELPTSEPVGPGLP